MSSPDWLTLMQPTSSWNNEKEVKRKISGQGYYGNQSRRQVKVNLRWLFWLWIKKNGRSFRLGIHYAAVPITRNRGLNDVKGRGMKRGRVGIPRAWYQSRKTGCISLSFQACSVHCSCVPPLRMPSWKTGQPSLFTSANSDCRWAGKVAVTLSGFPTQLSKRQSLSSAALSAPLCIKTALYVTKLLKLRIAVLCQAL